MWIVYGIEIQVPKMHTLLILVFCLCFKLKCRKKCCRPTCDIGDNGVTLFRDLLLFPNVTVDFRFVSR
jgi:hypothetical protein